MERKRRQTHVALKAANRRPNSLLANVVGKKKRKKIRVKNLMEGR